VEIESIIEGDGEGEALRVLLRRIILEVDPGLYVQLHRPLRRPKDQLKKQQLFTAAVESATRRLTGPGALLILLDADEDCPAELGPQLRDWALAAHGNLPVAVVVANREYEAWFLAAAESLRGHRGLAADLSPPSDPESVSGAKEWLSRRMPRDEPYGPTSHQASFSQVMSLDQARRAPSFDKLCRDVRRLVDALRAGDG
jgi:hypothetical protein